jgi:hypothetical protein
MRRAIAFVLSLAVAVPALYLLLCLFAGRLLTIDQADHVYHGNGHLVFLGLGLLAAYGLEEWFVKRHRAVLICCSGLVLLVAGFVAVMMLGASPSPEDSLQEARAAYMRHDLATFKNYVDVNSILSDGVDQLVVSPIARSAAQSDSGFGGLLAAGVAATAAAGKQVYLPELSQKVEQFVVTGSVPDQSQDDAFGIAVGSELLRMLAVSQLTYEGIDSTKQISDSVALVTVRVRGSSNPPPQQMASANNLYPSLRIIDSQGHAQPIERVSTASAENSPLLVTLKLRSAGSHWQVVGIQNLPDLAKQLLN